MSDSPAPGAIVWQDLTVPDAARVRDFYAAVAGWKPGTVPVADYEDFAMSDASGTAVSGICHARGSNASVPAQWLIYIAVPDVRAAAARAAERGGGVVDGPRVMGGKLFCVVRDPAGAVAALIEA